MSPLLSNSFTLCLGGNNPDVSLTCPSRPQSLAHTGPVTLQSPPPRGRHHVGLQLHQERPHGHLTLTASFYKKKKCTALFIMTSHNKQRGWRRTRSSHSLWVKDALLCKGVSGQNHSSCLKNTVTVSLSNLSAAS